MKIGFIATFLNEEKTINLFLDSLASQSKKPDEVVLVDGGSTDRTLELIKNHPINKKFKVKTFVKEGNISQGRNFAIKNCDADIITMSDAGCILEKNWLKTITKHFESKDIDVVAGYYKGSSNNDFQKSLVPYVLVMPDKVKPDFLPASRSMAIRRKVIKEVGGFSEKLNQGEDYDLALRLKDRRKKIFFEKNAIVSWIPRSSFSSAFKMFYRYAYGDIIAGNIRPKMISVFARYILAILSILLVRLIAPNISSYLFFVFFVVYSLWSINKNYKYVHKNSAIFYLPAIQFLSDFAVMSGSISAALKKGIRGILNFTKAEKLTSLSIIVFTILVLSVINWGLPNNSHPFAYHMDEWHQLQSVRNLFVHLSPNMEGSANGPIFHFGLSGLYVGLLTLVGLVNPFAINSSLSNLDLQNTLFIYLRLSTLFFSLATVGLLIYILKKQLNIKYIFIPVILFIFSPLWISLSNYFKYDIALIFWIVLFILTVFRFRDNPTLKNYLIAGIPMSLAICTKISALPLLIIYYLSLFIFKEKPFSNLHSIFWGSIIFVLIFLAFGVPDILLGTGNYYEYFHSNLAVTPAETFNYVLWAPYWVYLFTNQIPTLFGFVNLSFLLISIIYFFQETIKNKSRNLIKKYKNEIFLLIGFLLFSISLIPLKLFIINRSLVILPFAILFIAVILNRTLGLKAKSYLKMFIFFALAIHILQGVSWISTKFNDPREKTSEWIVENVNKDSNIGIENVPIYQFLPDIALSEYYKLQEDPNYTSRFNYEIIDSKSESLPEYIILTNSDIDINYLRNSPKKDLLYRMEKEGYKEIQNFKVNSYLTEFFTSRLDFFVSLLSPTPNIYIYRR